MAEKKASTPKKKTSAAKFFLARQSEITHLLRYLVNAYDNNERPTESDSVGPSGG